MLFATILILATISDAIMVGAILSLAYTIIQIGDRLWGKKKNGDSKKSECPDALAKIEHLDGRLNLIVAHIESEQRFRALIEKDMGDLKKAIVTGNGQPGLITRMALVEAKIRDLEK